MFDGYDGSTAEGYAYSEQRDLLTGYTGRNNRNQLPTIGMGGIQQRTLIMAVQYFLLQLTDEVTTTAKPCAHTVVRNVHPITELFQGTMEILFEFFTILFPSLLIINVCFYHILSFIIQSKGITSKNQRQYRIAETLTTMVSVKDVKDDFCLILHHYQLNISKLRYSDRCEAYL